MPESKYAIGLDYGTNSVRALIVDVTSGAEIASHVHDYESGEAGIILDPAAPHLARQNPADYLTGLEALSASPRARNVEASDPWTSSVSVLTRRDLPPFPWTRRAGL